VVNAFSPKFEILFFSGLTWLSSVDQELENTESPSAGELSECCNSGFSVFFFELYFPKLFDVTISASLATGILRTEIKQNKYLICKF